MLGASDWSAKFLRCKWNLCRNEFAYLTAKCSKRSVLEIIIKSNTFDYLNIMHAPMNKTLLSIVILSVNLWFLWM